ncbi:hypothetical protein [Cupriavidus basilensis]|uniref:hypothetical protein n=1 Tax=Cupriavidus basilensis TaxID=68895 RepID=UPI0020A647F0|nr:hypothetical protein [Cupriavidus basilensis]MCP3022363.1 hypothetical protein [Cupriavidus basilensis]
MSERLPSPQLALPFQGEQTSAFLAATRTRMQYPHESPKHLFVYAVPDAVLFDASEGKIGYNKNPTRHHNIKYIIYL